MTNPFADPESFLDYGVRVKDVKEPQVVLPRRSSRQPGRPTPTIPSTTTNSGFFLEKVARGYRLHNVLHREKSYDMDWSGALLPGDGTATPNYQLQDDWLTKPAYRTIDTVVFDVPSAPEYASTILALYRYRDTKDAAQQKLLLEFKALLADDFKSYWMMTSTRTTYTEKGDDIVEHCRNRTPECYTTPGALAGSSRQLSTAMSLETKAWLGVDTPQEFTDAVKWLTDKDVTWLYRCTKEKKDFGRALVLGVANSSEWFDINAGSYLSRPARGVAVRENFSTGTGGSR